MIFGWPLTVYGKLGKTAVGTHERGLFITFATLDDIARPMRQICGSKAPLEPNKFSGVLLELAPGATTQQVRFAVLANFPASRSSPANRCSRPSARASAPCSEACSA